MSTLKLRVTGDVLTPIPGGFLEDFNHVFLYQGLSHPRLPLVCKIHFVLSYFFGCRVWLARNNPPFE